MVGATASAAARRRSPTRACAIRWAEPRTLSSITITVTVAPLMMSSFWPAGAGSSTFWPGETGDQGLDLLGRNADQDDRLVMLDQLGAGDDAVRVDPDRDPDRLARVADRVDHVRVEEHPALQLRRHRPGQPVGALDRAQAIGAGDQVGHRELGQEPPQLRLGAEAHAGGNDEQDHGREHEPDQAGG